MAGVVAFMEHPLVTWVKTFNESTEYVIDFEDLTDGVFLNDVLLQIDERGDAGESCEMHRTSKDSNALIQNWTLLMRHMRTFYQDILQQTIVLEYPQILSIVKEPTKDVSLSALERVLLLLLGCAVQCQNKELYINRIKELDLATQQAIVSYIQQITEDGEHVVSRADDEKGVLQAVTRERDTYAQHVLHLTQERDYYKQDAESKRGGATLTPPQGLEQYHLVRQLAHANNTVNTLTTEVEDKSRIVSDLKDEVDALNKDLLQLKSQNLALSKDAKTGHAYRDEVDTYKERALKADVLEREVAKLKERLNEFDFYKVRVEELRSDVSSLTDQRDVAEEQLKGLQRTHGLLMDDLLAVQQHLTAANNEKETIQKRMEELIEEHTSLQLELSKIHDHKPRPLISYASSESLTGSQLLLTGHSISEELKDCLSNGMTQLEMERDELQHDLDDTKQRLATTQRELDSFKKTAAEKKPLVVRETQTEDVLEKVEKDLAHTKEKLATTEREFESLQKIVIEKQDKTERELAHTKERLEIAEQEVESLQKTVTEKQMDNDLVKSKTDRELAHTKERLAIAEREVESLQKTMTEKQRDADLVKSKTDGELRHTKLKLTATQGELDSLIKSLPETQRVNDFVKSKTERDLADTKQRLATAEQEIESLQKTLTEKQCGDDFLKNKVVKDLADTKLKLATTQRELNMLLEKKDDDDFVRSKTVRDLADTKLKLATTQRELESLKNSVAQKKHADEVDNKLKMDNAADNKILTRKHDEEIQRITRDFEQRLQEVKTRLEAQKSSLKAESDERVAKAEKEKARLAQQLESYKESWQCERDNYKKLETLNKDLISEKYQFKTTIEAIRQNSESCIKELEKEVKAYQIQADNAAALTETGECAACRRESNEEGVQHVMAEIERQYPHLIYPQQDLHEGINRNRPSSGRFSRESTPTSTSSRSVSTSMQSIPVQVSYVDRPPTNNVTPQKREKSSSTQSMNNNGKSTIADIMRPHSLRRSVRPASVMGLAGEQPSHNQAMRSGAQTPQRRPGESSSSKFNRGDKSRSTVIGRNSSNKPIPIMETFCRNDRKRMTMPEKRGGYVYQPSSSGSTTPKQTESSSISSHTLVTQDTLYLQQAFMSQHGTPVSATTNPSRFYHSNQDQETNITRVTQHQQHHQQTNSSSRVPPNGYNSDRDSGFATSPNTSPDSVDQLLGSAMVNAEAIRNSFRVSGNKVSEKWKVFVDKIVELQNKNQQLTLDHAEMKKHYNAAKFSEERVSHIEKKSLELEAENKKLRKIVESLQAQLNVGNPYDPREYHFYTNV